MKRTLFEDDIEAYANLIQQNHEYMISNPTILDVGEEYQSKAGNFQLTFNNRTIVQPSGSSRGTRPKYLTLSTVPRAMIPDDRYGLYILLFHTYLSIYSIDTLGLNTLFNSV